jgi:hypothetical protein
MKVEVDIQSSDQVGKGKRTEALKWRRMVRHGSMSGGPGELLGVERSRRADPAALCFQRNQDSFDSGSSGPSGTANRVLSKIDLIPHPIRLLLLHQRMR